MIIPTTFWFNSEKDLCAVELTLNGDAHQTCDIREWSGDIVLSKKTKVANQKFLPVDKDHLKFGYFKKEEVIDAIVHTEQNGLTYVVVDPYILRDIITKNGNLAAKIDRLQQEIVIEQLKQSHCNHDFNSPVYDPEETVEFVADISRGLIGQGSDPYYATIPQKKVISRWSRTCKTCGKKEYSYKDKVVHIQKEPDFS